MEPETRDWYVNRTNNNSGFYIKPADEEPVSSSDQEWMQRVINRAGEPSDITVGEDESRFPHPQAERVVTEILPAAIERYLGKCGDYGDDEPLLGAAGEYAQVYGKVRKLHRALWEGKKFVGEPPIEVMEDCIAHLALAIDYVKRNNLNAPNSRD